MDMTGYQNYMQGIDGGGISTKRESTRPTGEEEEKKRRWQKNLETPSSRKVTRSPFPRRGTNRFGHHADSAFCRRLFESIRISIYKNICKISSLTLKQHIAVLNLKYE